MKAKTVLMNLVIVAFLFTGLNVNAQQMQRNHPICQNNDMLELTDEQEQQIEAIKIDNSNNCKDLEAQMEILRAEKHRLMIADSPNVKAIDSKIEEMNTVRLTLQKNRTSTHLAIRALLTDKQKTIYDTHRGNSHHPNKEMNKNMKSMKQHDNCNGCDDGNGTKNGNGNRNKNK
jgi:Spy/CpxP family protein refolding chaperone